MISSLSLTLLGTILIARLAADQSKWYRAKYALGNYCGLGGGAVPRCGMADMDMVFWLREAFWLRMVCRLRLECWLRSVC